MTAARRPSPPTGLGSRARRLWRDLLDERDRAPEELALIVEACRMVQRLDDLDARLRAEWSVDAAREARLTAGQLKGLVAELRLQRIPGVVRGGAVQDAPPPAPADGTEGVAHDELAARRSAGRVSGPSG